MIKRFIKMHGAGNDYIYFDCLNETLENLSELAVRLSDRHFGIGGDGIVAIEKSGLADAKMRMFNMDGSEGRMCGNAIRCVGKYLYDSGIIIRENVSIETLSGVKHLTLHIKDGLCDSVTVDMGRAEFDASRIPVIYGNGRVIGENFTTGGKRYEITAVSMGNPHVVIFVTDTDETDVEKEGKLFEKNPVFPEGVNTEFVQVIDRNTLKMRVWERGSGETLACGTGACASVAAAVVCGKVGKGEDIRVILKGGALTVRYTDEGVFMTGKAVKVFEGEIEI